MEMPPRIWAVWSERLHGVACGRCGGLESEADMVVCDRCETPHHAECEREDCPVGRGPWYCGLCRGAIRSGGVPDPT